MPVSPAMAEDLAAAVADLYEAAEGELIGKIRRALAEGIDSPVWVELKLAAVGNLQAAIEEVIAALQLDASGAVHQALAEAYDRGQQAAVAELGARSEERRVGKACRSRGSPCGEETMEGR